MTQTSRDDWSPADNPYAIAVSEAQWWQRAVQLGALRLRGEDDDRISWFSSRQIDARLLVFALRQLLAAERLEQFALQELAIDPAVGEELASARQRFEDALPGVKYMRDALMHFDEWSRGEGRGPQRDRVRAGEALRDVAREYWGFAYDSAIDTISLGPYSIDVGAADSAAKELSRAIYMAAREVDKKNIAELRVKTTEALTAAGISWESPDGIVMVSPGTDLRIWISLRDVTAPDLALQGLSGQSLQPLVPLGCASYRHQSLRARIQPNGLSEGKRCSLSFICQDDIQADRWPWQHVRCLAMRLLGRSNQLGLVNPLCEIGPASRRGARREDLLRGRQSPAAAPSIRVRRAQLKRGLSGEHRLRGLARLRIGYRVRHHRIPAPPWRNSDGPASPTPGPCPRQFFAVWLAAKLPATVYLCD